jgi:hypothetical protein
MAIGAIGRFDADLEKFGKTVGVELTKVRKRVSFDIFAGVIKTTPVDTGRARFGWAMTDQLPSSFVPPPGDYRKQKPKAAGQAAAFADPFGVTVIANNVPYIVALEFGHSRKEPNGMVRVTLAAVEAGVLAELGE